MFCIECIDEYAQPDLYIQERKGHFTWEKYFHFNNKVSKAQRYTPIVPALGRLKHADIEFKALLGCITRLCLSKQDKTKVTVLRWGLPFPSTSQSL